MLKTLTDEERKKLKPTAGWPFSFDETIPGEGMVIGDLNQNFLYESIIESSSPFMDALRPHYWLLMNKKDASDAEISAAREAIYSSSTINDYGVCD